MKKLLCLVLAILMVLPMIPAMAKDADTDAGAAIYNAFKNYNVFSTQLENDGKIGIPVKINTYIKGTTNSMTQTIIYVINHKMERIGTENDVSIITDLLNDGYIVVVLDYLNSPLSVSPDLDWSVQNLRTNINKGSYLNGNSYRRDYMYVLPAGCRILRDVKYFGLLENGAKGTAEATVAAWNSSEFKNGKASKIPACEGNNYQKGKWFEATSVDQLVKPDGTPLDFDLRMDFIYPSKPKKAAPLFLWASSSETRNGTSMTDVRPMQVGLLFKGFAAAQYDHEYYPMARNDHYGYFNPYGTAKQNGVKTHTAAVRCARYYGKKLGYDVSKIGIAGHSKASYSALTAREHPELLEEIGSYEQYGYEKGENYGEQPFLTYDDGTPIPSNVQCCYTSMGDGAAKFNRLLNETTAPSVIACGYYDEFGAWNYWEAEQAAYKKWDVKNLAMSMLDLGHAYPYGIDTVYKYDRYAAMVDFFDYYLNNGAPKLVYTSPVDKADKFKFDGEIKLKFNAPMNEESIKKGVKVIKTSNNSEVKGTWTKCNGNTEWTFEHDILEPEETYNIVVTQKVTDENGVAIDEGCVKRFYTEFGSNAYSVGDAYSDADNASQNYGTEKSVTISKDKKVAYFKFTDEMLAKKPDKAELNLNVTNDAANRINIYEVSDFDENTLTADSAPALGNKIASFNVTGAGIYVVDLSEYTQKITSDSICIAAVAEYGSGDTIRLSFDGSTKVTRATPQNNNAYSSDYIARNGGNFKDFAQTTDYDYANDGSGCYVFKRNDGSGRLKFYNSFKNSALTKDDIGRSVKISFMAYSPGADTSFTTGLMCAYGAAGTDYNKYSTNYYKSDSTACPKDTWVKVEKTYVLDEYCVTDAQIGLIAFQAEGSHDIYIDDIKITDVASDVVIDSKEGNVKPRLLLGESSNVNHDASISTYIESGDNAGKNFDSAALLYVNGANVAKDTEGVSKSYIGFDISSISDTSKVELSLNAVSGSNQKINVYAVDAGEANVNKDSNGGSVHTWGEKTITWQNAYGNDKKSAGVDKNFVYGGAPVASINLNGAGEYKADVTSYINALKTQGATKATFILAADEAAPHTLSLDFENNLNMERYTPSTTETFSSEYNFRAGGAIPQPTRTNELKHSGLYSMKITRTYSYNRLKLFNSFKRSALDESDIGKVFDVTYWVYSKDADMSMTTSLMNASGTYGSLAYKSFQTSLKANTWTKVSGTFTIDKKMVDEGIGFVTLSGSGTSTIYVDDLKIKERYSPAEFSSNDEVAAVMSNDMETSFVKYTGSITDNHPYKEGYDYRVGCAPDFAGLSSNYNHTPGGKQSMLLRTKKGCKSCRYKIFNCVTKDRDLTSDDIGRNFRATGYFKLANTATTDDISIMIGLMDLNSGKYDTNSMYKGTLLKFTPNESFTTDWVRFNYDFTIDQTMVDNQTCMFAVRANGTPADAMLEIYLDDFAVKELANKTSNGPKLSVTKSDSTTESVSAEKDTYINNNLFANYGNDEILAVGTNGKDVNLLGSRKTILKFAKGDTEEATSTVLKFKTGSGDAQKISVWGIKDPSLITEGLNWKNAAGNDASSNGIAASDVYGNTPIAELNVLPDTSYEVNVFDYVKSTQGNDVAFIITSDYTPSDAVTDFSFDAGETFVENTDYRKTGAFGGTVAISSEKASSGKNSLKIANFNYSYARVKFMNLFKNTLFTADDKGAVYRVSMKLNPSKAASDGSVITKVKPRIGVYSNFYGTAGTFPAGNYIIPEITCDTWNNVSFDFTVTDDVINAKANILGICMSGSGVFSKDLYIDDLKVEKISGNNADKISILNNSSSAPSLVVLKPVAQTPIEEVATAKINEPVSSGAFKEGDTVLLSTTVKNSFNVDVESVKYYCNNKEVSERIFKDGYDYKVKLCDMEAGVYSVYAVVEFSNGESVRTESKSFRIAVGTSYTVTNTTVTGSIDEGKKISVEKTIVNNTSKEDATGVIIIAFYDANDNLAGVKIGDSKTLAPKAETKLNVEFESVPANTAYAKILIWNSVNDALPLVRPDTLTK